MAYLTEIGKTYTVSGTNIFAWNNYIPPAEGSTVHARGESTEKAGFSLENMTITVTEHINRIEEGHTDDPKVKKPYEIVKATVEGKTGEYVAWVVFAGIVKVTLKAPAPPPKEEPVDPPPTDEPVDPPPTDEPIDPPPSDPPGEPQDKPKTDPILDPPKPKPGDAHIEVPAGKTVVVEIKSDANGSGKHPPKVETGSFEITLTDKEGNPYSTVVYLSGPGGIYDILVDEEGIGRLDNIPVGSYNLSLEKPSEEEKKTSLVKLDQVVYFPEKSARITADGSQVIDEVVAYLSKPENNAIKKIEFKGFAGEDGSKQYRDNLRLQRAVAVKNNLNEKISQSNLTLIEKRTALGGELSDIPAEKQRKVEIWEELEVQYGAPRGEGVGMSEKARRARLSELLEVIQDTYKSSEAAKNWTAWKEVRNRINELIRNGSETFFVDTPTPITKRGIMRVTFTGARIPLILTRYRLITDFWNVPRSYGPHSGIDIGATMDTPIPSVENGKVAKIHKDLNNSNSWGSHVEVEHPKGITTVYCHLNTISIQEEEPIYVGQDVGFSGNSGRPAPQPKHLHFIILDSNRKKLNPLTFDWDRYNLGPI